VDQALSISRATTTPESLERKWASTRSPNGYRKTVAGCNCHDLGCWSTACLRLIWRYSPSSARHCAPDTAATAPSRTDLWW